MGAAGVESLAKFQSSLVLSFVVLSTTAASAAANELTVHIDFPGGSGEVTSLDQQRRAISIQPTAHADRGWACWWYVQVQGVQPGETIELTVGNAPWATPDRAAFSADNKAWTQTSAGKRNGKTITYRKKVVGDTCWFAWGPPFTPSDSLDLVNEAAKASPHAEAFNLCQTRHGRPVPALRVREANDEIAVTDRHGIWIQARQHAWESGSSWVARGLVDWLVSDDDRARLLRRTSDIYIVPVMDIDNVAIGAGGKNQKPQDHNRDWSDKPHWNAVREATRKIAKMNGEERFDLFIDLHNPGAGSKNPFFYIPPRDLLTNTGRDNLDRFLASVRLDMTGPLAFRGETQVSGPNYDKRWREISTLR